MTPAVRSVILGAPFNPYSLPNIAARYSLDGGAADSTYLIDGSNRLMLVADRSGNSAVNAVVCNGGASNSITTPTKSVTGNQVFTFDAQLSTWTPAGNVTIASKLSGNDGFELLLLTTGVIRLRVGDGAAVTNFDSTTGMSAAANTRRTIVATYVDGASGSLNVTVDGVALGTSVATNKTLTNAATTATFGMANTIGVVYSTLVGSVYNMNPSAAAKLAATFSSGGDTYTVNTSGDFGARICGARDLVQLTQANQPIFSVSGGYNIATGDGTSDLMQCAPYALAQPVSRYLVATNASATTAGRRMYDGQVNNALVFYRAAADSWRIYAGADMSAFTDAQLTSGGVFSVIASGAASRMRLNLGTAITGSPGTASPNGLTLGAQGNGTAPAQIVFRELLDRSVADEAATELRINTFLMRKWGFA